MLPILPKKVVIRNADATRRHNQTLSKHQPDAHRTYVPRVPPSRQEALNNNKVALAVASVAECTQDEGMPANSLWSPVLRRERRKNVRAKRLKILKARTDAPTELANSRVTTARVVVTFAASNGESYPHAP